jgi:hypothetical protein
VLQERNGGMNTSFDCIPTCVSKDSLVSKVSGHGLGNQGTVPSRDKHFSLLYHVKNGSWIHQASCPICIERVKLPGVQS